MADDKPEIVLGELAFDVRLRPLNLIQTGV